MTKRPMPLARPTGNLDETALPNRTERLIAIVDHCTAAKVVADAAGHRFLSYLLAMTIQEARASLRPNDDLAVTLTADGTSRDR